MVENPVLISRAPCPERLEGVNRTEKHRLLWKCRHAPEC